MAATQLLDYLGQPLTLPAQPPAGVAGAVDLAQRSWVAQTKFTTPEQVKAAWAAAESGDVRLVMQLADEVENDPRWLGMLRTRRLAVQRLKWRVVPADPGGAGDDRLTLAVTELLGRIGIERALGHWQAAILQPFAVCELEWDQSGGSTELRAIRPRLGSDFNFDYRESGEQLRLITPDAPRGIPLPPFRYAVRLSTETSTRLIARGGLVRSLGGRWLIKVFLLLNWANFAERDGRPLIVGKYEPGTQPEPVAKLKAAVRELGANAAAVISKDMEIALLEGMKNSGRDVFAVFIDKLDADAAIAILGQTLTTQGGDGGSGSYALGTVHNEVRQDLLEADAAALAAVVNQQVVQPYLGFKFGPQAAYPRFELLAEPEADRQQELTVLQGAQGMGLALTAGLVAERLGLPLADGQDGSEVLVPVSANPFGAGLEFGATPTAARTPPYPPVNGGEKNWLAAAARRGRAMLQRLRAEG